jgi:hypothetical protein
LWLLLASATDQPPSQHTISVGELLADAVAADAAAAAAHRSMLLLH